MKGRSSKFLKRWLITVAIFSLVISFSVMALVGCQKSKVKEEETSKKVSVGISEEAALPVSQGEPLKVDAEKKTVYVYAEVNGKYLYEPTRHGIVFKDGSNGDKAVFRAYAKALDFWNKLNELGAEPGDNVTPESPEGTIVQGDVLEVKVNWAGAQREYDISEVIKSKPDKGFEIRFGGNKERQAKFKTGCILCLDSCAAGITSNARWGWKSFETGKVKFTGDPDLLKDGQPVVVSFTLK